MASDLSSPCASIVLPTRMRLDYLRVALSSIAPQAANAGAELIVVDDAGPSEEARALAERFDARYAPHPQPFGLNVARNTGVECSTGELVVFVDDDVEVCEGWLEALLIAAGEHPEREVFTGPIIPRIEGSPPHSCGREDPPITALDLGPEDTLTRFAWGTNMTIRRAALERVGPFDVSLEHGGDEQEWQERLHAEQAALDVSEDDSDKRTGGRAGTGTRGSALYVAHAALHHRRSPADARLQGLCRGAFARGKAAQRFDAWRSVAPSIGRELLTLAGCLGHVVRYRCPAGLTMVSHSSGRLLEALRATCPSRPRVGHPIAGNTRNHRQPEASENFQRSAETHPSENFQPSAETNPSDDFLSGESGTVGGLDGLRRAALDIADDALEIASTRRLRLDLAARRVRQPRRVLALCVGRPEHSALVQRIRDELASSRHLVELCVSSPAERGKFENLNLLLDSHPADTYDWLFVLDDDIVLPHGFLNRFLLLAERFELDLAQPAHRRASHAAWQVTRRRRHSLVRETRFVEIGPVTAFARSTFSALLPFPNLRMGWGLDMHWAALAREHGWRCGVLDAVPIRHRVAPAASAYSREQALAEARSFLAGHPHLSANEVQQTLVTHRRL